MNSFYNLDEDIDENREYSDTTNDTLNQTIDFSQICYLCIHYSDGKCGSTLYHSSSHSIQLINEIEDNDLDSLEAILLQTEPNHVIISSKSDPKLIELLENCAKKKSNHFDQSFDTDLRQESGQTSKQSTKTSEDKDTDPMASELLWKLEFRFDLHIVSYTSFGFENAKKRILSINISNDLYSRDETQKILYISSFIDFSDNNTFRSFGALLRFLDFNCFDIQMQTNRSSVEISNISLLYLQQMVTIERNTYESLQIFQEEWHPSAAKQGINQKEGLSLYGLFNCCVSKIGANYLRKLFLVPTQEIDIIMERHEVIDLFVEPANYVLRDNLNHHLKHIRSVTALFNRVMTSSTITVSDIQLLYNNLLNALRIRGIIEHQRSGLTLFSQIKEMFTEEMDRLMNTFHTIVNFQKSIETNSFEINAGIDQQLDQQKYVFNRLPQVLEAIAQIEVDNYSDLLTECNCIYIPQIGFLTSTLVVDQSMAPHQINDELTFIVRAGDRYYYKTPQTLHLDQTFGDIQSEIIDRQIEIINQFLELIVTKKDLFVAIVKCCSKLDALIAMSRTAITFHYTKPNLKTDGFIEIIEGRHPLIELISKGFVANDYLSGGQYKKAKLLSGPNACGKSVYLKQICLIVYLAHIGSYVPALTANIPIIDRLFTRIHSPESLSLRLSTFMLDLKQMSNATKNATKRSLVVVDEFGKGTQPIDGLALMAASIDHWLTVNTPHLVISSHFRCLPTILNKNQLIDCLTFGFFRHNNQLRYLYKLMDGHFNDNIASEIAKLGGIPLDIVERSLQLCHLMANNKIVDCFETEEMKSKNMKYEEISKQFLQINMTSEEEIKNFFETNFCEYCASEE